MGFAEALSDDGSLTGRGHPWVRGYAFNMSRRNVTGVWLRWKLSITCCIAATQLTLTPKREQRFGQNKLLSK